MYDERPDGCWAVWARMVWSGRWACEGGVMFGRLGEWEIERVGDWEIGRTGTGTDHVYIRPHQGHTRGQRSQKDHHVETTPISPDPNIHHLRFPLPLPLSLVLDPERAGGRKSGQEGART